MAATFPGGLDDKRICLQCRRPRFDPWAGKIPWGTKWLPTPVFVPEEFHGQRSLEGYSPWGCKELDTTERLINTFTFNLGGNAITVQFSTNDLNFCPSCICSGFLLISVSSSMKTAIYLNCILWCMLWVVHFCSSVSYLPSIFRKFIRNIGLLIFFPTKSQHFGECSLFLIATTIYFKIRKINLCIQPDILN